MIYLKSMKSLKQIFFLNIFILMLFSSCIQKEDSSQQLLINHLDSLRQEIKNLNERLSQQEQVKDSSSTTSPENQPKERKQKLQEKTQEPAPQKTPPLKVPEHLPEHNPIPEHLTKRAIKPDANDTIKHFYVNKKISVLITPWKDGKRQYFLYDLYGNVTYEMEEIRLSYQQSISLKFHENGAVSAAKINLNPGASRYWYETEITFDSVNEPIHKKSVQLPVESVVQYMEKPEMWDRMNKRWIKQEIIREYNTPDRDY
jgi:hypothetical protein